MPDLLSMLRLANIFSPTGQTTPQQFPVGSIGGPIDTGPSVNQGGPDLMTAIQDLLTPKDQQFNTYADMISSMPRREDYAPSKFRQIAAAIAGMGAGGPVGISNGAVLGYRSNVPEGLKIQQAINEEPYSRALTDWSMKVKPQGEIAQMEQTRNVGNRATGLGVLQRQQAQEKLDEQERRNLEIERQGREKLEIQRDRAEAYIKSKNFQIEHPEYKAFVDEDGNLVLYNPTDPTAEPIETGVKKLSEMEKIDLQVQGQLKVANARAAASQKLEGIRQANRKEIEGVRQINRLDLKTTPSGTSSIGKPLSPAATATDRINKAIEIINARPELQKYFVIGGNKKPTGQYQMPKGGDSADLEFIKGQMGASDIKLPSNPNATSKLVTPSVNIQPQSRELSRTTPEDPKIKAARAKVEAGYVLITDGKSFGQVKPADISKLPAGWSVVK